MAKGRTHGVDLSNARKPIGRQFPFGGRPFCANLNPGGVKAPQSTTFAFRCPNTGLNVQGWSAEEIPDEQDTQQTITCAACGPSAAFAGISPAKHTSKQTQFMGRFVSQGDVYKAQATGTTPSHVTFISEPQ